MDRYTDEYAIELFSRFRQNRKTVPLLTLAPYPRPFDEGAFDGLAMPFQFIAQEALREIPNAINDLCRYIHFLHAWQPIYDAVSQEVQHNLLLEQIRPLTVLCLGAPQALRGRLIYAATAASFHANAFIPWPEGKPDWNGGHTSMETAKRMNKKWSRWPALASALSQMNTTVFNEATSDFRNQHEHGSPRSIALGHTSHVKRVEKNGRVGWSLGEQPPMQLNELLPLLEREHGHALNALNAYIALVDEQHAASQQSN